MHKRTDLIMGEYFDIKQAKQDSSRHYFVLMSNFSFLYQECHQHFKFSRDNFLFLLARPFPILSQIALLRKLGSFLPFFPLLHAGPRSLIFYKCSLIEKRFARDCPAFQRNVGVVNRNNRPCRVNVFFLNSFSIFG